MPAHFVVTPHPPKPVPERGAVPTAKEILTNTWQQNSPNIKCSRVLQSSFVQQDLSTVRPMDNGFVNGVTQAYNLHHHLILRPDDVWIAILCQFNLYVSAHGEDLRSHFVAHEGQEHLVVFANPGVPDFGALAKEMTDKIQEKVVDPALKDWILPKFTTTTDNDTVVSAVIMMSTLKNYFTYEFCMLCGIPSVTLEGEKSDWEQLLSRVHKFKDFGPEPAQWADMLQPILSRFISAFDGNPDVDFWNRVCLRQGGGSGPTYLSGWITAFCVWNHKGEWQATTHERSADDFWGDDATESRCEIDGVRYPSIDTDDIPPGYCEVEVRLNDNGVVSECMMVSGHLACQVEGKMKDGLRPLPSWFMFETEKTAGNSTE